jgi:competence protein ComFB
MDSERKLVLINVSEGMLDQYLDPLILAAGCCNCERCRLDVKAIALNDFKSHYVVTERGEAMSRAMLAASQSVADITMAITKAALYVKGRPRHK